jgi:hypothetical protein
MQAWMITTVVGVVALLVLLWLARLVVRGQS